MGFDVNVLDENGETALNQIFRTSNQSLFVQAIFDNFFQPGRQTFNVDPLMEYLGKHFSLCGYVGFGPCVLLQLGR